MMRQQPAQFEWHCFEESEANDEAWAKALSPTTDAAPDASRNGEWRSGHGWRNLLSVTVLFVVLWRIHPWPSLDAIPPGADGLLDAAALRPDSITTTNSSTKEPQTIIQPGWQPMLKGIQHYFQLCQQQHSFWSYLAQRPTLWRQVSTLPLYAVYPDDMRYRAQIYHWSPAVQDEITLIISGTFAEYVAATYGQACLFTFLNSFNHYSTWAELSPAIFGIPAVELEAGWHSYLASQAKLW